MRSLKQKIMIPIFIIAGLGVFLLSYVEFSEARKILYNYIETMAEDKVDKLVSKVENQLQQYKNDVDIFSSLKPAKGMNTEKFFKYFSQNKKTYKGMDFVFLADKKGNFQAINGAKGTINDRDYFYEVLSGKTVISDPVASKSSGKPVIIAAAPIRDNNGNIIGVVGGNIELSYITDTINEEKIGNKGYAFMINSYGLIMAHPNKDVILKKNIMEYNNKDIRFIGENMIYGKSGMGYYKFDGEKKVMAYKPIKSTAWAIGMTANYKDLLKDVERLKKFNIVLGIVVVLGIVIVLYLLINSIIKPINGLKNCMQIATSGNLTVQYNINRNDELGSLANSFNTLIKENKRLLDETIEYDRLKTEFFGNISHELKTPLNIIFSSIQLLNFYMNSDELELDKEKLNSYIEVMQQNSYRLIRLVNNLIDITRIDSGLLEISLQNKNIVDVVEEITLSTVQNIEGRGREIVFDTDLDEKVMAIDMEKIERVVLNLISNAVKFTNNGDCIEVGVWDKGDKVVINVKDTGIGIPEDKQKVIFERFRQVDLLYNRNHEGSGIGLSIVKALVEMHGGNISVQSIYGKGSNFIVELPVKLVDRHEKDCCIDSFDYESKVEKIKIEFSDIY